MEVKRRALAKQKRRSAKCAACGNAGTFRFVRKPASQTASDAVCAKCGHKPTPSEIKEWLEMYFRE